MTEAQKKRSVSDAVKGANEDSLSAAADFMARKNEDIETGSMKDMERALLNSQRSLDNSKAARDEAAALVLANSPTSGIPPALRDPMMKETQHRIGNTTERNEIARNAFNNSRFHMDINIDNKEAEKIKDFLQGIAKEVDGWVRDLFWTPS